MEFQIIPDHTILRPRITSILISRFLFHLQAVEKKTQGTSTHLELPSNAATGTLIFQRVVGSVASSLSPEVYGAENFEEDYENDHDGDAETPPALSSGSVHDASTGTSNENTAAVATLESAA